MNSIALVGRWSFLLAVSILRSIDTTVSRHLSLRALLAEPDEQIHDIQAA